MTQAVHTYAFLNRSGNVTNQMTSIKIKQDYKITEPFLSSNPFNQIYPNLEIKGSVEASANSPFLFSFFLSAAWDIAATMGALVRDAV